MHPAMEQLSQLLGGALLGRGHRVQLVQGEGDQGPSRLVEALKQMGGALTQSAGGKEQKETSRRSRPKSALPPILPGTPITEVLRTIRQTLAAAAANAEPDDDEEEDDEDAAGEAAADTSFGRIIAHLDERGLELLERQLRGKLALVSAARTWSNLAAENRFPYACAPPLSNDVKRRRTLERSSNSCLLITL